MAVSLESAFDLSAVVAVASFRQCRGTLASEVKRSRKSCLRRVWGFASVAWSAAESSACARALLGIAGCGRSTLDRETATSVRTGDEDQLCARDRNRLLLRMLALGPEAELQTHKCICK